MKNHLKFKVFDINNYVNMAHIQAQTWNARLLLTQVILSYIVFLVQTLDGDGFGEVIVLIR